jgi:uncharacterized protein (TIGR02271 family)
MLGKENFSETDKKMYNENLQKETPVVIPVIEEIASIDKQVVTTGKIRIEKQVQENNETAEVNLLHDEYTIKRVVRNEYVDEGAPQVRYEGDTLIIPVVKEVMVKRLLLVEEVHVIKEVVPTTEQVNVPLRKETVTITRTQDIEPPSA